MSDFQVEMGSKNHEIVPTSIIDRLARLRGGSSGVNRSISTLAKAGLIGRVKEASYDGYRLTYGGLDYLALHTHVQRDVVYSVGHRVGVGKESDIVMVADPKGRQLILKIHRLGRISFRTVKSNRDYLKKRQSRGSWMYLSRLSAMKEYAFMVALREQGFTVPEPIAQSRHTIAMSFIDNALPLRQVSSVPDPASLYAELIDLILRLASHGLIHGDFNEFNILIQEQKAEGESAGAESTEDGDGDITLVPVLIDFPQMLSMEHKNAEMYFDRDVACVKRFFERRFHFVATQPGPFFKDAQSYVGRNGAHRIDAAVEATGFTKKMSKDLEAAILEQATLSEKNGSRDENDEDGGSDVDEAEDEDEEEDSEETENGTVHDPVFDGEDASVHDITVSMPKLALRTET